MTKKGWKSVLVSEKVFNEAKEYMEKVNEEKGFNYFRSMAHLVDIAIDYYVQNSKDVK